MTYYELLLILHIVASIIWLGAGFMLALLVFGAARAGDHQREATYHEDVGWLTPRLFIPASMSVFVLGILLVLEGSWTFDQLWIVIALAGWLTSFLLGILFFKPEAERLAEMAEQRGPTDPEIQARVRRVNLVERVQLVVLFLVVVDMVLKPTGNDAGLLIAGAVILLAATGIASAAIRRGPVQATVAPAGEGR